MAVPTNTFQTFQSIGNREDLEDTIYNIAPKDTPFLARAEKLKAKAELHEWQTDTLAAPGVNAQVEGDDITIGAVVPTVRLGNRCQISTKSVSVSGSQQAIDKAGRRDEMVYQMTLRNAELRKDQEFILVHNSNTAPSAGSASTARVMRSLIQWIKTNDVRATVGTAGVDATYTTGTEAGTLTDGTTRPFTEALLKTAIQNCYTQGGSPETIMTGPFNKTVFSTFTGNATNTRDASGGTINAAYDVYKSDFGTLRVIPSRVQRERDVLVLDMSMWGVAQLRKPFTEDLAKTGDSDKAFLGVEYTLVSKNEKASSVVADCTTS